MNFALRLLIGFTFLITLATACGPQIPSAIQDVQGTLHQSVCLDGAEIKNKNEFHEALGSKAHFPAYYGRNLDALWDVLSTQTDELNVFWYNYHVSRRVLNADENYFERIRAVFHDAKKQGAPVNLYLLTDPIPRVCS